MSEKEVKDVKKQSLKSSISGFLTFVWNPKRKEFLGRDGASWAKISIFYSIFYLLLSSFFIGMLAVLSTTLDIKRPTYFSSYGVMGYAQDRENGKTRINPGLGFRPQLDPESQLITYSLNDPESVSKIVKSLDNYINKYYHLNENSTNTQALENCENRPLDEVVQDLNQGKYCKYPITQILKRSLSNPAENYLLEDGPTVLLKLNRIYSWIPKNYSIDALPKFLKEIYDSTDEKEHFQQLISENVIVRCTGEYASDIDMLKLTKPLYYSSTEHKFEKKFGVIPFRYFPYLNQNNYESPAIIIKFDYSNPLARNVLTNVICKAYAANIDSDDKLNRRGMTIFSLYVDDITSPSKSQSQEKPKPEPQAKPQPEPKSEPKSEPKPEPKPQPEPQSNNQQSQ